MFDIATTRPRTRDLGLVIGPLLNPGKLNAITDVPRVKVGMVEKISGDSSSYASGCLVVVTRTPYLIH